MSLLLTASGCATHPATDAREAAAVPSDVASLTWLGSATVTRTTGGVLQHFGGISGMDYDRAADRWYLLSDDRSEVAPARFYVASMGIGPAGFDKISVATEVTLRQADGSAYPDPRRGGDVPDGEAIRIDPKTGELVWSSEGDRRLDLSPWVRRTDGRGRHLGEWRLPSNLKTHQDTEAGSRHNLSLEGLAFTPDGSALWMAMEAPLYEDGPVPTTTQGAPVRFSLVARNGELLGQYVYPVEPIPIAGTGGKRRSDNGVSEILAVGRDSLLVVERSGHEVDDLRFEFSVRIYLAQTRRATNVASAASLIGGTYEPMSKRLLAEINRMVPGHVDNIEAAAWGPRLTDGRLTLVLASDDNFAPNQVNQFMVFAVNEP